MIAHHSAKLVRENRRLLVLDNMPPEIGLPLAAILWAVWFYQTK
jgi:hypothetical protein